MQNTLKVIAVVLVAGFLGPAETQVSQAQALTVTQLNTAYSSACISNGVTTSVLGQAVPHRPGDLGATTAITDVVQSQYLEGAKGSAGQTVTAKLQDVVNVVDFGADPTGATDSTAAFRNAAATLGRKGGIVRFRGWFLINDPLTVPDGVVLEGDEFAVGHINGTQYTPANFSSALILNPANSITLGSRNGVRNTLVLTKALAPGGAYALPFANATIAANAMASFSGTAFAASTTSTNNDERLDNLLVLGFSYIYKGGLPTAPLARPVFRHIYGDNTNGIAVAHVSDLGLGEDLHMWPFTTVTLAQSNPSLLLRTGTAYSTGAGSTWMKWDDAYEYGYAIGHMVDDTNNVRQINCGAESPTAVNQYNVGFLYRGVISYAQCISCTAAGNGNTGFLLNASSGAGYTSVRLISPTAYGNNSSNGYVDIKDGNYAISGGLFSDNSSVGHVQIESTAGSGMIIGTTFANNASKPAIFGNAAAIANMQLVAPIFTGASSSRLYNSLSNLSVSGQTFLGGANHSQSLTVNPITNSVNHVNISGAQTGDRPLLQAAGIDSNVGLTIATQGTGGEIAFFDGTNSRSFSVKNPNASPASNYLGVYSSLHGVAPTLYATGDDRNVSVNVVPKGTGTFQIKGTSVLPNLSGSTASIGGKELAAGACASGLVSVENSTTAMAVVVSPVTYPGDGIFWHGYVSGAGVVTVKVCASVAATPTASAYNVRVLQ